ncbi:Type I restriction-modification system, DNA-methyltransferase subunit M [Candidatus Burkholderia verschuerenii]|uniref:site-specific DNA-methyltransferase (adenine-specific) n=1 Tax=Candidatus Burkholderia verschuerenii TaxID=242163 RepID=A0A0L0MD94_9BURK|nr:class I SAM-dependent DNA methyltransferase [Candidatus Burkholderia verschuerenii]KND60261.1 Type I restriction-modification system, DNA-methyltransferase subunit M [Candidatus Burkholderia verschuerenii]
MANNNEVAYTDTLWKSADALRGQVDAAEYKHVVLGLLFLKYISDSFEARREELKAELTADGITGEQQETLLESHDEYTAERVFWVPPEARWASLQSQAARPDIATLIDDAILVIERDNPNLKNKLPRDYARRGIEPIKLKGLIELIADIGFKGDRAKARDTLGRVYEYFLGKFAQAEGKLGGGEFFTPRSVVRVLVEMIEPYEGRVYDLCCGSGGMFVQSESFVEAHGGNKTALSIFGQESNPTTWRLAHMNLAIRSIEANLGPQPADTFLRDLHPDLKADYILSNPPFNVSDWSAKLLQDDVRWRYGVPPAGNANYTWIQHFIHHIAPPNGHGGGVAGFVMANGSLSSNAGGEGEIRQRIIEADLVDCIVALPAQLFFTTGIPVCLWFVTRDKTGRNLQYGGRDRKGETLFIDARKLGALQTRTLRVLSGCEDGETMQPEGRGDPKFDTDIGRIVYAFRQWRGEPKPDWWNDEAHGAWAYRDVPGFCSVANIEQIKKHGFVLTPGRYVGAEEQEFDGEPFEEKYARLLKELDECFAESERLTAAVRRQLGKVRV